VRRPRDKWYAPANRTHAAGHYLLHCLRDKIVRDRSRVVFVSSGAVRNPKDLAKVRSDLRADSGAGYFDVYTASKLVQLMGAHYWRRQLQGQADVIAVSPGMIPDTKLSRHTGQKFGAGSPDAKDVPTGARSLLEAFTRSDWPADPNDIFLTSWGDWWKATKEFPLSLDEAAQAEWCPSKQAMEQEAHL
jgi:hypothetical protein